MQQAPFDTASKNTETCLTYAFPSVAWVKEVETHDITTSRTGFEPRKQESSYQLQWKLRKFEDYRPPGGPDLEPAVRKEGGGFEPQKPSSSARGWDEQMPLGSAATAVGATTTAIAANATVGEVLSCSEV